MAQIMVPQQRPKRDAIDLLTAGLQAAQTVYGIRADMAKLDEYKQNQETGQLKLNELKDERAGILTPSKQLSMADKLRLIPEGEASPKDGIATLYRDPADNQVKNGFIVAVNKPSTNKGHFTDSLINPATGKQEGAVVDENTGAVAWTGANAYQKPADVDFKKTEFLSKIQDDFHEKYVKDPLLKFDNAATVKNLANLNDPMADRYLNTALIPMLSGMNRMNETEIRNSGGSPGLINQAEQYLTKAKTGETYTPQDRASIVKMANVFQNFAKQQVIKSGHDFASQKANVLNLTQSDIYDKILKPDAYFEGRNGQTLEDLVQDNSITTTPTAVAGQGQQPLPTLLQPGQLQNQTPKPSNFSSGFGGTAQGAPAPQPAQKGFNIDSFIQKNRRR
jgi:hypothetical protein